MRVCSERATTEDARAIGCWLETVDDCGPLCLYRSSACSRFINRDALHFHTDCPSGGMSGCNFVDFSDSDECDPPQSLGTMCIVRNLIFACLSFLLFLLSGFCTCVFEGQFAAACVLRRVARFGRIFFRVLRISDDVCAQFLIFLHAVYTFFSRIVKCGVLAILFMLFVGDPQVGAEQVCALVLSDGPFFYACVYVLSSIFSNIQGRLKSHFNRMVYPQQQIARPCRLSANRLAQAKRTRNVLDGGCTNHTLMRESVPYLEVDRNVVPANVHLSLAGGSRLDAALFPQSEEVWIASDPTGSEENLLSQDRICSFGGRVSVTWYPETGDPSQLVTALLPGSDKLRATIDDLVNKTEGVIRCSHEDRTTYVSDDDAWTLRNESIPARRAGGNFDVSGAVRDEDVSLRILGVSMENFNQAYLRHGQAFETLHQLKIPKEILFSTWKRCTDGSTGVAKPKTFIATLHREFDRYDRSSILEPASDLTDDDDIDLSVGVSFGSDVVAFRARANQQRAPRLKRDSRRKVPVIALDSVEAFANTPSPKSSGGVQFVFLFADGRHVISCDKSVPTMSPAVELLQRITVDKEEGTALEYHRLDSILDSDVDGKTKLHRLFCDVITVRNGNDEQAYLFVFALHGGSSSPCTVAYSSEKADEAAFLSSFNQALYSFRLHQSALFELVMESEGFLGLQSLTRFAETGALLRPTLPGVSPWQEVFCRSVLRGIRTLLSTRNLPPQFWPEATSVLRETALKRAGFISTSDISASDLYESFGKMYSSKIPTASAAKSSKVEPTGTECVVLGPWGRSRWGVKILFGKEKAGFSYTAVDWRGCSAICGVSNQPELCFQNERDGLVTKRFIHKSLAKFVATEKPKKLSAAKTTCPRCRWDRLSSGERERGRPPVHDYGEGCNLKRDELVPLATPSLIFLRDADVLDVPVEQDLQKSASAISKARRMKLDEFFKSASARRATPNTKCGSSKFTVEQISEKVTHRGKVLSFLRANRAHFCAPPEVIETVSGWAQSSIRRDITARAAKYDQKIKCYAVAYNLEGVKQELLEGQTDWLDGLDRELRALVERGVLKIIPVSEISPQDELLPSLLIMTRKNPLPGEKFGRAKFRLTACGNYAAQQDTDNLAENYAETLDYANANAFLRLCLCHGFSGAMCDVSEAFTQTQKSENARSQRRILRPPSQLKHLWCDVLREHGFQESDIHRFAFLVCNSIYGERDAPKLWSETFAKWITDRENAQTAHMKDVISCVQKMGFTSLQRDSRVYVKFDKVTQSYIFVLVYVDDVICLAPTGALVASFMDALRKRFRCTEVDWLRKDAEIFADAATGPTFLTDQYYFELAESGERFLRISQTKWLSGAFDRLVSKQVVSQEALSKNLESLNPKHFTQEFLADDSASNPILTSEQLTKLRSGVNTLSYLGSHTRLEILPALGAVARGQSATTGRIRHLESLELLIRYVKTHASRSLRLWVSPTPVSFSSLCVEVDADASMGSSSPHDCFARQGYVASVRTQIGSRSVLVPVFWKSGLQSTISVSSTESEVVCASWATRSGLLPLHYVVHECFELFGFAEIIGTPILYQDNESAAVCAQGGMMRRLRHLTLHQLYIRHACRDGLVRVKPKRTKFMSADVVSKVMSDQTVRTLLEFCSIFE